VLPTLVAAPAHAQTCTLTGITPASGPASGGTPVTISGAGFTDPGCTRGGIADIVFGSTVVTTFTVVDDSTITLATPPGPAGNVPVEVDDRNGSYGDTTGSVPGGFTYTPTPDTSSLEADPVLLELTPGELEVPLSPSATLADTPAAGQNERNLMSV
jgi:hypothetical protein